MINQNINAQEFETNEILTETSLHETKKQLDEYIAKVNSINVNQVKNYLGLAYFAAVILLFITLLL